MGILYQQINKYVFKAPITLDNAQQIPKLYYDLIFVEYSIHFFSLLKSTNNSCFYHFNVV